MDDGFFELFRQFVDEIGTANDRRLFSTNGFCAKALDGIFIEHSCKNLGFHLVLQASHNAPAGVEDLSANEKTWYNLWNDAYEQQKFAQFRDYYKTFASSPGCYNSCGSVRDKGSETLATLSTSAITYFKQLTQMVVFQTEKGKSELRRFFVSLIIFVLVMCLVVVVNVFAHMRFPSKQPPLPDFGHDLFGPYFATKDFVHVPDHFILVHTAIALIVVAFSSNRFVILRRFLVIYSALMFTRSLCIISTSLPEPCPHCRPECLTYKPTSVVDHLQLVMGGLFPASTTCGDYMFSGHTVMLMMLALLVEKYQSRPWLTFLVWVSTYTGIASIVATRLHYTIDVMIGIILSIFMFRFYHMNADIAKLYNQLAIEESKLTEKCPDIRSTCANPSEAGGEKRWPGRGRERFFSGIATDLHLNEIGHTDLEDDDE